MENIDVYIDNNANTSKYIIEAITLLYLKAFGKEELIKLLEKHKILTENEIITDKPIT